MATEKQELLNEVATVDRDFITPAFGGIMRPNDDTLLSRGQGKGLKIYDDIERDGHAYSVLQKRKMAVISREWTVVPPANAKRADLKAAELVREVLENAEFDQLCLGLLDALLKGYAVGEVMWAVEAGRLVVTEVRDKDQRRFTFDTSGKLRLLVPESMVEGIAVPERKFLVHQFGAKDGNPFGLGLGNKLFWPVFFKRQGITFWLTFADKFGSPTAVGEYPTSAKPEERATLLAALGAISQEAAIAIPQGMAVKLLEAARSGSVDTYEKLCRYMDEQISEAVLGETLTTNIQGGGSRAATQTHNEVRKELSKADADLLSATLNKSLIPWIVELNLPGARPPKVWRVFDEPEDLKARTDRDKGIFSLGYEPTPEYIQQTYGDGWVPRARASAAQPPAVAPEFAEGDDQDVADQFADQAGRLAGTAMDGVVDPIRELVDQAASLEDLRDGLLDLYPQLDASAFTGMMQRAIATSFMAGRFEVADGR